MGMASPWARPRMIPDAAKLCLTVAEYLPGLRLGHYAECCVYYQVTCGLLRQPSCGYFLALTEMFPANCSATVRKLLGNCWDATRKLRRQPDGYRPVTARKLHRQFGGCCADITRLAALHSCKGMVSNPNDRLSHSRKPPQISFD